MKRFARITIVLVAVNILACAAITFTGSLRQEQLFSSPLFALLQVALITWFVYVIYLHLGVAGWKRPWQGPVASCVGFGFVIFTYLGVTYLLSSLHRYVG